MAREGHKKHPTGASWLEGLARVAQARGDNEEAVRRWLVVRKRYRRHVNAYIEGSRCLVQLGRWDEAEAWLAEATRLHPHHIVSRIEHAGLADRRKDFPLALKRWELIAAELKHVVGEMGVARALNAMGRVSEAEQHLEAAMVRHPLAHELALEYARISLQQERRQEAAARFAALRRKFPTLSFGFTEGSRVLEQLGDVEMAKNIAATAIKRFPGQSWAKSLAESYGVSTEQPNAGPV